MPYDHRTAEPKWQARWDAERAFAFFRDTSASGVVVVTLPEEMPTNETLDLLATLRDYLSLPIAAIVVNSTLAPLFSGEEGRDLGPFAERPALDPAGAALSAAGRRALAERTQAESLERLAAVDIEVRTLPRLDSGADSPAALLGLGRALL